MAIDAQSGLTLFNAIATAGKTIYEIAQGTSKLETKQQLMEVYDTLMNLKREAAELEDQNHDLKEKLRFKSDEFEFKNPFWFDKKNPDRALCPSCFSKQIVAPVAAPYDNGIGVWRKCLSCDTTIEESRRRI
jgi:hypothetical protein